MEIISHHPSETETLGETWAKTATAGWIIGLSGDLGAGKTQLVKGLARGLGLVARIQSPTFALVNEYRDGRLPLFHLDLYRLETRAQIVAAGLEYYFFQREGVSVIEWIERWTGNFAPTKNKGEKPRDFIGRWVKIETINEMERRISYEDFGA